MCTLNWRFVLYLLVRMMVAYKWDVVTCHYFDLVIYFSNLWVNHILFILEFVKKTSHYIQFGIWDFVMVILGLWLFIICWIKAKKLGNVVLMQSVNSVIISLFCVQTNKNTFWLSEWITSTDDWLWTLYHCYFQLSCINKTVSSV